MVTLSSSLNHAATMSSGRVFIRCRAGKDNPSLAPTFIICSLLRSLSESVTLMRRSIVSGEDVGVEGVLVGGGTDGAT